MKQSLFASHITAAVIITVIILCMYVTVQQTYRSSANDPQLQIARDISKVLTNGRPINKLLPFDTIDLEESFAVFVELFDKSGRPLQSIGLLNKQLPQPPQGVINYTNNNNEDIITWQPQSNVRMAMVFEKVNTADIGYVAFGRSLAETEVRESNLLKTVAITWALSMAVLLLHYFIQFYLFKKAIN